MERRDLQRCTTDVRPLVGQVSRTHKRCPAARLDPGRQGPYSCLDRQCRRRIRVDQTFCHMHLHCPYTRSYVGPVEVFDFDSLDLRDPASHAKIVAHYLKPNSIQMCNDILSYMKSNQSIHLEILPHIERLYTVLHRHSMATVSDMMLRCSMDPSNDDN